MFNLVAPQRYYSVQTAIDVWKRLGGVIVVVAVVGVTIEPIQVFWHRSIRFDQSEHGIPVQGKGDRIADSYFFFQMNGRDVVMVIITAAAMTAPLVKFPGQIRVFSSVIQSAEDGYAVDGQRDGAPQRFGEHGDWLAGRLRVQGQSPRILTNERLGQWNLLLPCTDSNHHVVIGQTVGINDKKLPVNASGHRLRER